MEHPCLSPWKGALIGGAVGFLWGAVSWMGLPFHERTLAFFQDAAPVVEAVKGQTPGSGVYILRNDPKGQTAPTDPFLFVSYNAAGWGNMGAAMLQGLLLQAIGGFFWTWILGKIPGLSSKDAALYGAMFGLCVGVLGAMPNTVWWKFPFAFNALYVLDAVIAWTIASPLIARFGRAAACALPSGRP